MVPIVLGTRRTPIAKFLHLFLWKAPAAVGLHVLSALLSAYSAKKTAEKLTVYAENSTGFAPEGWLAKASKFIAKFLLAIGFLKAAHFLRGYMGTGLAYSLPFSSPFIIGTAADIARNLVNKAEKTRKLLFFQPDKRTLVFLTSLIDIYAVPLYFLVMDKIASLSSGILSPAHAALSVALAALSFIAVEYTSFALLWTKLVFRGDFGSARDLLSGFASTFHPFGLANNGPVKFSASTALQSVGMVFGQYQGFYLFSNIFSAIWASAIALAFHIQPSDFVHAFCTTSVIYGRSLVTMVIGSFSFTSLDRLFPDSLLSVSMQSETPSQNSGSGHDNAQSGS